MTAQGAIKCFICGGTAVWHKRYGPYRKCNECKHETLVDAHKTGAVENDALDSLDVTKKGGLDRFKLKLTASVANMQNASSLLDIGSGSGKFLFQCKEHFAKTAGIEVSPASVEYARQVLGLSVHEAIDEIDFAPDLVTAWHALEHIPHTALEEMLSVLQEQMPANGAVLISVPNVSSFQSTFFGTSYAFWDVPNHLHQFSAESLDRMMLKYQFLPVKRYFSTPYNTFGWIQGTLNKLTGTHNYLYYRLKRNVGKRNFVSDFIHIALGVLLAPFSIIASAFEYLGKKKQGVITTCYRKPSAS